MSQRGTQEVKAIKGPYTLKIVLTSPDGRRRDLGNYEKAVSDFLQASGIIQNDNLCQDLHLVWGTVDDTTYGTRVIISSVDSQKG